MSIALAAVGFTSTIAQVVLMRELVATFYDNELLFGLVLAAWPAWVAERRRLRAGTFATGLALAAARLPVQIGLVRDVLAAVLLVPVLGIPQTCAAVALVGLAELLALV